MSHSRAHSRVSLVLVVVSLALFEIACSSAPPEQQLLINFFRAARVRDNTTLGNISAVTFNPRTEGTVEDFDIVSVSPEQRRPVQIRALVDEEAKAREEEAAFSKQQAEFQTLSKQIEMATLVISLRPQIDTAVFGLNWRPLYQLKVAARQGLDGLADYASTMVSFILYLPVLLLWGATILFFALVGWRILRWTFRTFFNKTVSA